MGGSFNILPLLALALVAALSAVFLKESRMHTAALLVMLAAGALILLGLIPSLRRLIAAFSALGTGEPVRAALTEEAFPRRDYDSFSLPAGSYRALRVTLGAGAGHNWWCVAFPALCLPAVTERGEESFAETALAAGFTPEEIELVTSDSQPVQFRFALLDWLAELFE